jgi:hypothetical protein
MTHEGKRQFWWQALRQEDQQQYKTQEMGWDDVLELRFSQR